MSFVSVPVYNFVPPQLYRVPADNPSLPLCTFRLVEEQSAVRPPGVLSICTCPPALQPPLLSIHCPRGGDSPPQPPMQPRRVYCLFKLIGVGMPASCDAPRQLFRARRHGSHPALPCLRCRFTHPFQLIFYQQAIECDDRRGGVLPCLRSGSLKHVFIVQEPQRSRCASRSRALLGRADHTYRPQPPFELPAG